MPGFGEYTGDLLTCAELVFKAVVEEVEFGRSLLFVDCRHKYTVGKAKNAEN